MSTVVTGSPPLTIEAKKSKLDSLVLYGACFQNGTPTPSSPISVNASGVVFDDNEVPSATASAVTMGISDANGNSKTASVIVPYGLAGIQVTSGGNYTDPSGQQWLADTIDINNGVINKNIGFVELTGDEGIMLETSYGTYGRFRIAGAVTAPSGRNNVFSNRYVCDASILEDSIYAYGTALYIYPSSSISATEFKTWLTESKTYVYYPLASPTTENIPEETLTVFKGLAIYDGVNTITSNANYIELGYSEQAGNKGHYIYLSSLLGNNNYISTGNTGFDSWNLILRASKHNAKK